MARPRSSFILSVDHDSSEDDRVTHDEDRPAAPKRRRRNDERFSRLAGFAAAARVVAEPDPSPDERATLIAACVRGYRIRRQVAHLRPGSAGSSSSRSIQEDEEVPEAIEAEEQCASTEEVCSSLAMMLLPTLDADEAEPSSDLLAQSCSDLESSGDSSAGGSLAQMVAAATALRQREASGEQICAICIMPMHSRRRAPAASSESDEPMTTSRVTLECSHKFHRKCLLSWTRQRPHGGCPCCREPIVVKRKAAALAEA